MPGGVFHPEYPGRHDAPMTSAFSPCIMTSMTRPTRNRTIAVTAVAGTLAVERRYGVGTPAMQAGLTHRRLSFRDIFSSGFVVLPSSSIRVILIVAAQEPGRCLAAA